MNNHFLVAVVGHPSTGKDTVAKYIYEKYGCDHASLSDILRGYIKENNLGEPTRDLLSVTGENLRAERGGDYLLKLAFEKTKRPTVFSAIRTIAEAETFKKEGGIILAVTCPIEVRYQRSLDRGGAKDGVTFEKFKAQQEKEAQNTDPNRMSVDQVIAMADYKVENNGSIEELFTKVETVLKSIPDPSFYKGRE